MPPCYKVLISFLPLAILFLLFADLTQNIELFNSSIRNNHFDLPIRAKSTLNASDLHLNTFFIEENKSFEEEEQRSARNRIGTTLTKKYRRADEYSNIAFCIYDKSDPGDITPQQLHLRL